MRPAFSSRLHMICFGVMIAVLLALPYLVSKTTLVDRRTLYPPISYRHGVFPWIQQQTYEKTGDIDLAVIGSSQIWCAVHAPTLQKYFTQRLGREAVVLSVCFPWPGFDSDYVIARNLLENRKVRTLLVYDEGRSQGAPHMHASRWFCIGQNSDSFTGLPWLDQVRLYGGTVMTMPRHLLSACRTDLMEDPANCQPNFWNKYYHAPHVARELGTLRAQLTFKLEPNFKPMEIHSKATPADAICYSPATRDSFSFRNEPRTPFDKHFAEKLAQLCQMHGTRLVFLHTPDFREKDNTVISEQANWTEVLGTPADLVGIPPAKLFAGLSQDDLNNLFYEDAHLNQNGQDMFTPLIAPALFELYEKTIPHH